MMEKQGWKKNPFWIRLLHWEFWRFHWLYLPIYPVWLYFSLRARSFFFFSASNPSIQYGGFVGESKKDIHKLIPVSWRPLTLFFAAHSDPDAVWSEVIKSKFRFPMMGKPDFGGKGRGVKKLDNEEDLKGYVRHSKIDFHIQEFVSYDNEIGIFYYRMPGEFLGNISGIVQKEFLQVRGDGVHTVIDLLRSSPRAILQLRELKITEPLLLDKIPDVGEQLLVSPYGNHARGALFLDHSETVTAGLVKKMDEVCQQIPGFFFGRLDIRYQSRELLDQGKSFMIIEVNGAGSEPTHIYDPRHSVFFAWKEIVRHLNILFKISRANHRLGHPYLTIREGLQMFKKDNADAKLLAAMKPKK